MSPEGEDDRLLRQGLQEWVRAVEAGESVLNHRSADMHPTGMMAFALLRWLGVPRVEAVELIHTMRPEYLIWGNTMAAEAGALRQ